MQNCEPKPPFLLPMKTNDLFVPVKEKLVTVSFSVTNPEVILYCPDPAAVLPLDLFASFVEDLIPPSFISSAYLIKMLFPSPFLDEQ